MNSLAQHIAVEEPEIVTVAIGPGRVDTEMQREIRDQGSAMTKKDHANFVEVFEEGKLNKPEWPGNVIAKLSLDAKPDVNGKYLRYDPSFFKLGLRGSTNRSVVGMRRSSQNIRTGSEVLETLDKVSYGPSSSSEARQDDRVEG